MKKLIIVALFVLLFVLTGCESAEFPPTTSKQMPDNTTSFTNNVESTTDEDWCDMKKYKLYIKGAYIGETDNLFFGEDDISIPFFEVLEGCGASFAKKSENTYLMEFDDESYILNTENVTLIRNSDEFDYLIVPPGGTVKPIKTESELYISSSRLQSFFDLSKTELRVRVSPETCSVCIEIKS